MHLVRSLIELLGELLHLRVATLAREPFQLARRFACFVDQLLLLSLITTRSVRGALLATSLFFECLLLSASQLFQTPFGFALLTLCLLLLPALHRLILVLHLVELELKQAGQFLLLSFTTTAAAVALITKRNLHFAEDRIRSEQTLKRALLGREGIFAGLLAQRRWRAFHLLRRLPQVFGHFSNLLLTVIDITESAAHAIEKLKRVGAQFLLSCCDCFVTVFAFLLRVLVAFTNQTMRGCDQIFLPSRQRVLILIAALALPAAALLRLLKLHLKRLHFDEVNVARRFVTRVARLREVRDEIAGFEIVFFKKERVGAGQRTRRFAG